MAIVGRWLCLAGAVVGALGLVGWFTGAIRLLFLLSGLPAISPTTCLSLVLIGVGGYARGGRPGRARRAFSALAALAVLLLGVATLAEYAVDRGLGIPSVVIGPAAPNLARPAALTALSLSCLALALLLLDRRPTARARPAEWFLFAAAGFALVALTGMLFGVAPLYRLARTPLVGVSLLTVVGLLLVSLGLLLQHPEGGFVRLASSPGPGGVLIRRLLIPTIATPILLGAAIARLLAAIGYDPQPLAAAILAVAIIPVALVLLARTAAPLDQQHAALERSRAKTRELLEQAPDGIFLADLDGRYTDVNGAGCRMLGYTREEILAMSIADLIPPEDLGRLSRHRAWLLQGEIEVSEWNLRKRDGTWLPVEVSARILPDGRWQGFVRDISERKRLEEEERRAREQLRESQERFELAVRGAGLAAWDWNIETGEVRLNARWAEMRGLHPAEVRPHIDTWLAGLHPDDAPRVDEALRRHFRGETAEYRLEYRVRGAGGRWLWILDLGKVFARDERGAPTRMVGVELDITEQRRIRDEQAFLAEVGSVLAATLDYEETATGVAKLLVRDLADICIVDAVEEHGRVHRLFVAHRDPGQAALARDLERVTLDRRRPSLGSAALETGQPVLMSHVSPGYLESIVQSAEHARVLHGLGPRSLMATPLVAHGRVLGALVLLSTTSGRVYTREDLSLLEQAAARAALAVENARLYRVARRAIRARDEVLGIVAHDLRGPLSTIILEAEVCRRRHGDAERGAERAAEAIERAATRMSRLIQDLLEVTRIEAAQLSIERSRVPSREVVLDAARAHEAQAGAARLELRLDLAADLPDLWADRDRILQVFDNLIGNAIKFTEAGGAVILGAGPVDGNVLFRVTDTGAGILAEDLPHVFDRFWQTRKGMRGGAGLGLAIVKGIVEAHGGRVWAESASGRGSTFFFTIPAATRLEERRPEPAPPGV